MNSKKEGFFTLEYSLEVIFNVNIDKGNTHKYSSLLGKRIYGTKTNDGPVTTRETGCFIWEEPWQFCCRSDKCVERMKLKIKKTKYIICRKVPRSRNVSHHKESNTKTEEPKVYSDDDAIEPVYKYYKKRNTVPLFQKGGKKRLIVPS